MNGLIKLCVGYIVQYCWGFPLGEGAYEWLVLVT